ncbi:hypothetical protein ILYODFUR_023479 [Ilyodon furcidens]|uniref:Uncharacterized protein n=1 Tax=Ilyodon furcidens TaxID=33524 RepID=A0ABV0UVY5_9TELE
MSSKLMYMHMIMTQTHIFMGGGYVNVIPYHPQCYFQSLKRFAGTILVCGFSTFEMQVLPGAQKCVLSLWPEGGIDRMTDDTERESSVHVPTDLGCQKLKY